MIKFLQKLWKKMYMKWISKTNHNSKSTIAIYGVFLKKDIPNITGKSSGKKKAPNSINLDNEPTPLTFAATISDACSYIDRLYYIRFYDHFKIWCEQRGLKPLFNGDDDAWEKYQEATHIGVPYDDDYIILQLVHSAEDIAFFLRVHERTMPVGLSCEFPEEVPMFLERYFDDETNELSIPEDFQKLAEIEPECAEVVDFFCRIKSGNASDEDLQDITNDSYDSGKLKNKKNN